MTELLKSQGQLSDALVEQCTSKESVSSLLGNDPTLSPGQAWKQLYGNRRSNSNETKSGTEDGSDKTHTSRSELELAATCGNWGPSKPSDLFLKIYNDALCTLNQHPEHGMVSPSLMGSCGVVPLTIISVIPDIVRHMSNLIVRAEKEVFLATNYWQDSVASKYLTDAIRELDRRAGIRGTKVVVKILYDRGDPRQLFEPRYLVSEKEFTGKNVALPRPHEIPNVDMQVMNYHRPMVGTFHSKYMLVDRRIALLQSNNIQDNANLEMLVHLEGPIVDSMYDMALLSWHKKLNPPLPTCNSPATQAALTCFGERHAQLFESDGTLGGTSVVIDPARISLGLNGGLKEPGLVKDNESADSADSAVEIFPERNRFPSNHPNGAANSQPKQSLNQEEFRPEHRADDPHYDDDIPGEVARVQAQLSPKPGTTHMQAVTRLLDHTVSKDYAGAAPECPPEEYMTPYIPHPAHDLIPMALVNRSPYGPPTHQAVSNPQNAAWLSALKNATRSVFIQSPTLNAEPLIPAIQEACERGVDVYCYICLGYNDAGELLPHQNGHNELIANTLYQSLSSPEARAKLHYNWYVAKDQTRPIHKSYTDKRNSHIKLMIVDEQIGIIGNGNQDTQSWYHSQEINLMLDSPAICRVWMDALRRNQNTHVYGALDSEEGVWRGEDGEEVDGAIGVNPGRLSWLRGAVGAVRRVKGTGGF